MQKKIVRGRGLFRALALRSVSVHEAYQGRSVLPDPEGQESSLYELQSVRNGKAEDIGVKQHDDSHDSPECHRMPCDEAENNSLVAHLLGGGSGNRDGLGIDHFAHDSPSTVCRAHENGVDSELLRCNSLQAPKQRVGRRIASRQRHTQPAKEGTEEWVEPSGPSEREA